ncbi:MAG: Zn-dependent alcohol dehydrogenase [Pseudomonadales bacterium]|nr:Zn-dependent alcohol dehydrogenase [Pseudomonadales bacterium]
MKIKAVVMTALNEISVEEIELDPPKAGEVRVRMVATGVCHSDLSVVNGTIPFPPPVVLGHEGAGVIEEIGEGVTNVKVGDHIITTFVPMCGECFNCLHQEPWLCTVLADKQGCQLDGTSRVHWKSQAITVMAALGNMAEQIVCPAISVVPIKKHYSLEAAALVGCGVMTGAGAAMKTAAVEPGSSVAVFGCGGVGISAIQGARISGANPIIAVDLSDEKLAAAKNFGATHTVNASTDPVAQIMEMTGGIGVDYAFEVIGVPAVMQQTFDATRRGGTAVMVGVGSPMQNLELNSAMLPLTGKTVMGCLYGSCNAKVDFPRLMALYEEGKLDLDGMQSRTYSIDEAPQAFEDLKNGKNVRGVIVF